ncbi:SDR family oxidoreductase [Hahella chejuensis]|uniref:SDR family oxidoreductase n=1 Tax=Hahella chejuensis TaxID=158327 RepID=UPI0005A177A7|nr:SDR family NAD(P)-dependent oxidoreductase [Hahella chejuensis]
MMTKTNPVVLITGASSGIGHAAAVLFAEQGWNVVATMRKPSDGEALTHSPNIKVYPLDVTDSASVEAAVAETLNKFGRIKSCISQDRTQNRGLNCIEAFLKRRD